MTESSGWKSDPAKDKRSSDKETRLAEALRTNLRRRKAQSAARKDLSESDAEPNDGPAPKTDEQTRNEKP